MMLGSVIAPTLAAPHQARRARLHFKSTMLCLKRSLHTSARRERYRILMFGADDFSCTTLKALYDNRTDLVDELVVIVPPDQRTGRGLRKVHRPPLRILAEELQLETMSLPTTLLQGWQPPERFRKSSPDSVLLTASFGHLIPSRILSMFEPLHTLNVHPSLLPKYRGAAPIQWTIANGDRETGVTVQELSRGKFDHGRILGQSRVAVPDGSTFTLLEPVLAQEGGRLLVDVLRNFDKAKANARLQDSSLARLAPKIGKDDARVKWSCVSSEQLIRLQNGIGHQIPLWSTLRLDERSDPVIVQLKFRSNFTEKPVALARDLEPGSLVVDLKTRSLFATCRLSHDSEAPNGIVVDQLKMPNGKWNNGWDWYNGVGRSCSNDKGVIRLE
ncbi:Methionyl-tRNA formyltransferase [Microbotryomycetes sp. JL201]|nr:Methionyl-tRNA formyltransferase [Microbotryomycetes sp. JL201]